MTEKPHPQHLESTLSSLRITLEKILSMTEQAAKERESAIAQIALITEAMRSIAKTLDTHYSETLNALVGKNQLPLSVAMKLFQLMGWLVICSTMALIFTLTGQHFDILPTVVKAIAVTQ